jgi:hypothetical protein
MHTNKVSKDLLLYTFTGFIWSKKFWVWGRHLQQNGLWVGI